jgi:hypothetical protein
MDLRISVSTLQAFNLLRSEEWMTDRKFLEQLDGVFVRTPEMAMGESLHAILEAPELYRPEGDPPRYTANGISWPAEIVGECLTYATPGGTREVNGYHDAGDVLGHRVTVSARADQILGAGIHEHKTKWKAFDYDGYADSYQWRWYLLVFGAAFVRYNVFAMADLERGLEFRGCSRFTFHPYDGLEADCAKNLRDLVEYATDRGLLGYLAANRPSRRQVAA